MSKIREITLREIRTEKDVSILVAKIDESGNLVLEGYDVGEFPKAFWGDDDYEYYRVIKREHKDTILSGLINERFSSQSEYRQWLHEKDIPEQRDYSDTVLLWLIKEGFNTDSDFKFWLDSKSIPNEFWSWV